MINQFENSPYKPIACADYDVYEIAIMQKRCINLSWTDQHGQSQHELIMPLHLQIKDGAEYLLFQSAQTGDSMTQNNRTVRLDQIQRAVIVNN